MDNKRLLQHRLIVAFSVYFDSGVSANVLNEKKQSPIHMATELNRVTALKVMGNYRNIIDIQKGGEHGRTALHLAAIYDHEECARILVRWVKWIDFFPFSSSYRCCDISINQINVGFIFEKQHLIFEKSIKVQINTQFSCRSTSKVAKF